jgi:hypothetical protein
MKKIGRSIYSIINYKTLIITALSILSTYLCIRYGFTANFPDMLVGVAIVFPVVFSIGSAFTRRETALQRLADFKGHAIAIYYASRDWCPDKNHDLQQQMKELIHEIMKLMKNMFLTAHDTNWHTNEVKMYLLFSKLSELIMEFRKYGVQSGEISRLSQYLSKIIIAFDNMKIIHNYRTPITLRMYSKVFIYIFPIIYGPYFASMVKNFSPSLEYVMPVLYSFILVSLDNIQDHLENPFDDVGEDDINIDADQTTVLLS